MLDFIKASSYREKTYSDGIVDIIDDIDDNIDTNLQGNFDENNMELQSKQKGNLTELKCISAF